MKANRYVKRALAGAWGRFEADPDGDQENNEAILIQVHGVYMEKMGIGQLAGHFYEVKDSVLFGEDDSYAALEIESYPPWGIFSTRWDPILPNKVLRTINGRPISDADTYPGWKPKDQARRLAEWEAQAVARRAEKKASAQRAFALSARSGR